MIKGRRLLAVALCAAVSITCSSKKSSLERLGTAGSGSHGKGAGAEGKPDADAPKRALVTSKRIQPLIHELGEEHVVPTAVVIELATPIVERGTVGSNSSQSVVKVTPETAGTLVYSGVSELTFTPARPFDFNTNYTIDVQKLETQDGLLAPPDGEKWSYSFKTPSFEFLSWAPTAVEIGKGTITMQLTFSGAVLPNIVRAGIDITVDGHAPSGIAGKPTTSENTVEMVISDQRLALGTKLGLTVKSGLRSLTDAKAPAAKADYVVSEDKAVAIKTAVVTEGSNGFYVEVICDDDAAPSGNRSYYEGEGYYNLSQRCQLDDEAISRIHFDPPVKKSYITAGRAGFRIFGDFKRGAYSMKIDAGARTVDGGMLLAPFAKSFSVSARKPQLSFAASGRYLPRTAWTNLGIKHLNVEGLNLVVRQIPPENLVFWLGNDGTDAADERTSDVILKKSIPLRSDADVGATTWLDVAHLLPATTKGVLELRVVGVGAQATSRLMLTNLSLVAKKTAPADKPWMQTVQVWALDMDSADTLSGVEVDLVRKSGKIVGRCTTSGDHGCSLTGVDDDLDQSEPFALIAHKGDDLTYLRYSDLRADVSESSTSGVPYVADVPYRAAIYADRGVYRPGDTTHITAIVRDIKDHAPDQSLPIDVQVIDPRAKVVRKIQLKTNPSGVVTFDHSLPQFADTGHWRVSMTVANVPLAEYNLQVEEFVPERMKVTATPKRPEVVIGDKVEFEVAAQYLFGGSAVESGVDLSCSVEPTRFEPKENSDLTYGVDPKGKAVSLGEGRGQIEPDGKVVVACPEFAQGTAFAQTGLLTASASVLEAGSGRATVKSATAMLHPEKFYLGVRTKAARAAAGETFTVEGMVVDWNGKLAANAPKEIQVEMVHLEADYGYGYDDGTGESRYDRWMRQVPEGKQTAKVTDGHFSFDVTPGSTEAGYVVRVSAGKAKTELLLDGEYPYEYYGYGDGERGDATPRAAKPTQLAVKLAKAIEVGKPVEVKLRSPYKGRVLWTIETDHVVKSEWKDIAAGDASWSFQLDEFAPNVYVTAFVVKDPHLESKDAFMPDRAFGIASTKVTPTDFTQAVTVSAPQTVRSSSPLAVQLDIGKTTGPAFATVAVVDEGILQLTNFQTPDPLAQLFPKRALSVETYETIGWTMLHAPAGASSKTGGGDDSGMNGEDGGALDKSRVQPVKPVALFSGIVAIGADGKATIPFNVPQYRGQLRVMAIVSTPTRIGRADTEVTVRDPLVIQTTFPRFITQNDEVEIPVFLTNMSGGTLDVSVVIKSDALPIAGLVQPKSGPPPLQMMGKDTGAAKIEDGHSETLVFQAKATMPVGGGHLTVVAKAKGKSGSFEVKDELDVPFLPPGPKERVVQKMKVDAGTLDLVAKATALKNWAPTSETTTFWLTNNPFGESFSGLSYLIHYPYGCIEQTTSTVRPLLYVSNLVEQIDPQLAELKIEDMVLAGINRVFSMETPSGGFGYWPGSTEAVEWGTAYATHMLLDAKKAGYAVPDDRLAEVLKWIDGRVAAYERGQKIVHAPWNHYDEQSEAYLHYVLALAGKGKKGRIAKLISEIPPHASGEQAEDLYTLKAALYLTGDRRYEKDLKAVDTSPILDERINSWSFYSDRRRRGFMLSTFHDLFGNDPAGELLAQRVAEMLAAQPAYYYNTQELVWGITGLGKWVQSAATKGTAAGKLTADGAEINSRTSKHKSPTQNDKTWALMRASEYKSLTLDIPQQAAGMWLVINSEGVRPNGDYKVGGNGLDVSRSYKTLDSTELDPSKGTLKLGDLLFVEIEVENTSSVTIQNIALVDRLPAGFEIENPRLGRTTKPDWVKDEEQWAVDFMNMRDDHLEAFGQLGPHESKKIVYTVRAVTSGKFTIPPVEAGAMYDPTLWARAKGGTAVVGGPWTGKLL